MSYTVTAWLAVRLRRHSSQSGAATLPPVTVLKPCTLTDNLPSAFIKDWFMPSVLRRIEPWTPWAPAQCAGGAGSRLRGARAGKAGARWQENPAQSVTRIENNVAD